MNAAVDVAGWWSRRSPRERAGVVAALAVVALAIGWALWQPLARDLAETERAIAETRSRVAQARARADEAALLAREARPAATADARAAVMRVLAARGLRSAATSIDAQDGGIRVTFADVGLADLAPWLETLGRDERLFPVEMTLTRRVEPGRVRAEIALAR